jgi:hypothetical protein
MPTTCEESFQNISQVQITEEMGGLYLGYMCQDIILGSGRIFLLHMRAQPTISAGWLWSILVWQIILGAPLPC